MRPGFGYPGHTEYLAALAGMVSEPVMMLAGGGLRVVPVTIHLPLRDAIETLSTEMIVQCARVTAAGLTADFGIAEPRLALAALNPHGGEGGSLGMEEIEIIAPAAAILKREGYRSSALCRRIPCSTRRRAAGTMPCCACTTIRR